jgi:hypothetical protein
LRLESTFGMTEMECAAVVIIDKAVAAGTWLVQTVYQDMKDDTEQTGFIQLIFHGWLRPGYYKRPFYVNQGFIDRVNERHPEIIAGLPKRAPTFAEISYSQVPIGDPPGPDGEYPKKDPP